MTLNLIRNVAINIVTVLTGTLCLSAIIVTQLVQGDFGAPSAVALLGLVTTILGFAFQRQTEAFRYLLVTILMSAIAALLAGAAGTAWQTDIHMVFFASLAVSALLYDYKVIVLGAVVVAVHHVLLGMTLPDYVFYGGGGLPRIILHAIVLIVEAGCLIWMHTNTFRFVMLAESSAEEANQNANNALKLAREVEESDAVRISERQQTLQQLREEFGSVIQATLDGQLGNRVADDLSEPELKQLAQSINDLITNIERGLSETATVMVALSLKDLTQRVDGDYAQIFSGLKSDTNAVAERMTEVISAIRASTGTLTHVVSELLDGAESLSVRTKQQADTVRETAQSIELLSRNVDQTADRANRAQQATETVVKTATRGTQVMREATVAMERIAQSSEEIAGIISMIDDIAFQTNLLALNASVEAARAGEAGRGFDVVAVEVRRLAQSAAASSAQIKSLIEVATYQVGEGTALVSNAAETLNEISSEARTSNSLMHEIASATAQQNRSLRSVDEAVRHIDMLTQQNAELVRSTHSAVAEAQGEATSLDQLVGQFKLSKA
jgi:methyl-accepting chemotaxis protein